MYTHIYEYTTLKYNTCIKHKSWRLIKYFKLHTIAYTLTKHDILISYLIIARKYNIVYINIIVFSLINSN